MVHSIVLFQRGYYLGHFALLLADGDVDAYQVAAALVDNRVQRDGRFAGGTVSDDQLPLPSPYGDHGVHGLDACLHWRVNRLPDDHVRCDPLNWTSGSRINRPFAVQRAPYGVNHPAYKCVSHWHFDDSTSGAYPVSFFYRVRVSQNGRTYQVGFKVQGQPQYIVAEVQQLVGPYALKTLNAGYAVADLDYGTYVDQGQITGELFDLALDQRNDFLSSNGH